VRSSSPKRIYEHGGDILYNYTILTVQTAKSVVKASYQLLRP